MSLGGQLTREGAQQAARNELARPEYDDARPSLFVRAVLAVVRTISGWLDDAGNLVPSTDQARVLLVALLGLVVAVVLVTLGPISTARGRREALFDSAATTAADHRRDAEQAAGAGDWAVAVRERLRAVVRELEVRGILDARAGRTAGEVAVDAGAAVPALAADLTRAAVLFEEIWYGGRPAGREQYESVVAVDARVRTEPLISA